MKRVFYLVVVLFMALTVNASDFKFDWAHIYDAKTTAGDSPIAMSKATDGNYFSLMSWGSTDAAGLNLYFDGNAVADASGKAIEGSHAGSSYNNNMCLQKLDAKTGSPLWTVYSNNGYLSQSYCDVESTSDGGAVVFLMVRSWDNHLDTIVNVVDAAGAETNVTWEHNGHNIYFPIAMKVDADGNVKWMKQLFSFKYCEDLKYWPNDLFYSNDMAVDKDDNIYLCGSFRSTINFKKANGEEEHITAKNVVDWDGDVQDTNGDLFLAKFDKDGNYLQNLTAEGTAIAANIAKMDIHDATLYAYGRIMGDGTEMSLGGKPFTAAAKQSMLLTSININDLSVNYARMFNASADGKGVHLKGMQWLNGSLYLTGSIQNGTYTDGDNIILTNTKKAYVGCVVKCAPSTGDVIASGSYDASTSEFFGVAETKETLANNEEVDSVLAYGYKGGYFMVSFSQEGTSLIKHGEKTLVDFGRAGASARLLIDGTSVVLLNRGSGNGASGEPATFYGTDFTLNNLAAWSVIVSKFTNNNIYTAPSIPTGINNVNADSNKAHNYDVYTFNGCLVKKANSMSDAVNGLNKGFYIIGNKKVIIK